MQIATRGGGSNAGYGWCTNETGMTAVEDVHHIRDFRVTLLRLLWLDHNRLTDHHAGRFKRLNQLGGKVIDRLLAWLCVCSAMTSAEV